jgi:uncharacterized protein YhdP
VLGWQGQGAGQRPQLLRQAWAWGRPLQTPTAEGRVDLALPLLDLDAWQATIDRLDEALQAARTPVAPQPEAATTTTTTTTTTATATATAAPHPTAAVTVARWPGRWQADIDTVLAGGGRTVRALALQVQRADDGRWLAEGRAAQGAGSLAWTPPTPAAPGGHLQARLTRLVIPRAEADRATDRLAHLLERPAVSAPTLDIAIDTLQVEGRELGRLQVQASATARDWRLDQLSLDNPDARLSARGVWGPAAAGDARHMALDFGLDVIDGGRLLQRLGFGQLMRGASGRLQGRLGWDGSPWGPDLPTLDGQLDLALGRGQFLQVDPGAAKLLGVLSLQALPRRLTLDFRDVFAAGFSFDEVAGQARIEHGLARTEGLRMRGVQALVQIGGQADLVRQTQDLKVAVIPELDAGTASLAWAALVNPVVGVGSFVGQWLLRGPLESATTRLFEISGSWDDPQVRQVQRGAIAAAAAAREAATAAPGTAAPGTAPASAPAATPATPAPGTTTDGASAR